MIGAGAWGTTVAHMVSRNVDEVIVWGRDPDVIEAINGQRTNPKFLPNIQLNNNLVATNNEADTIAGSKLIIWAIPVQFTRERIRKFKQWIGTDHTIINLSKGIEHGSCSRPSQIFQEECGPICSIGTLGGGNIASEIAAGKPASAILAMDKYWEFDNLTQLFLTDNFNVTMSPSLVALEIAGALKNIVALAAGICDGLELGWNYKSSIIARGFQEMRILGQALGASPECFVQDFSLGDVITTCCSPSSRNRFFGESLGRGASLNEAIEALNGRVAEGITTTHACSQLTDKLNMVLPILNAVTDCLNGKNVAEHFLAATSSD